MNRIRQCDLVVTENCFLKCKMCHIWKHVRNDTQISFTEYSAFLHSLRKTTSEDLQIQFVGGEPLLKEGILELIRLASDLGFQTTMTTNGILVNEKTAEALVQAGLSSLVFSLESMEEKKHDFLRGAEGVHAGIMRALEYFKKFPTPKLFISTVIAGYNTEDLVELAKWVNGQERIDSVYFQAIMQPFAMPEDDLWYQSEECGFLWPDSEKVSGVMDQLAKFKRQGYKLSNPAGQFEAFKAYFKNPQKFIKKTKCNLGYSSFTVLPDGNIFLCLSMGPIGNIKTDKIDRAWFSEQANKVRQQIDHCRNNCKLMINCFFEDEHV
jgi:MoaA/NifB/PqqE/SkfB family radical SAM enzyme